MLKLLRRWLERWRMRRAAKKIKQSLPTFVLHERAYDAGDYSGRETVYLRDGREVFRWRSSVRKGAPTAPPGWG